VRTAQERRVLRVRVLTPGGTVLAERDFRDGFDVPATPAFLRGPRDAGVLLPLELRVSLPRAREIGAVEIEFAGNVSEETVAGDALLLAELGLRPAERGFRRLEDRLVVGTELRSLRERPGLEASAGGDVSGGSLEIAFAADEVDADYFRLDYSHEAAATSELPRLRLALFCAEEGDSPVEFELLLRPGSRPVYIPFASVGCDPTGLGIQGLAEGGRLEGLRRGRLEGGEHRPIPADLGIVLEQYPRTAWRNPDYELFSWNRYPEILLIDTRSYAVQSRFFKRLAFFVEKRGFRGRLLSNAELAPRHGWNAHNYRAEGLADFFTEARRRDFPLNDEERRLREIVLANGVIREEGDRFVAGRGGILSISQESFPLLRELLLTHEAFHGVFYADGPFRDGVYEIWEQLRPEERDYWRRMLSYLTYDPEDSYLMVNEFQGYVLQQTAERVRAYLRGTLSRRFAGARDADYVASFLAEHPESFVRAGRRLNRLAWETARLRGGRVYDLRRAE
jgi:hypothetical protein